MNTKHGARNTLSEDVGVLPRCQHMENLYNVESDFIPNKCKSILLRLVRWYCTTNVGGEVHQGRNRNQAHFKAYFNCSLAGISILEPDFLQDIACIGRLLEGDAGIALGHLDT